MERSTTAEIVYDFGRSRSFHNLHGTLIGGIAIWSMAYTIVVHVGIGGVKNTARPCKNSLYEREGGRQEVLVVAVVAALAVLCVRQLAIHACATGCPSWTHILGVSKAKTKNLTQLLALFSEGMASYTIFGFNA